MHRRSEKVGWPQRGHAGSSLGEVTLWKSSSVSQLQPQNYGSCLLLVLQEEVTHHPLIAFSASLQSSSEFPFGPCLLK